MPRQEIAVVRQEESTNRNKEKEFS